MNQTILHRTAPRYSLLAAAVLSSLATADATPPVYTNPTHSSGIQFSCLKPEEVIVAVIVCPISR